MELDIEFVSGLNDADDDTAWTRTTAPNMYWIRHTSIFGGTNENPTQHPGEISVGAVITPSW
jgi:hypothetical protein